MAFYTDAKILKRSIKYVIIQFAASGPNIPEPMCRAAEVTGIGMDQYRFPNPQKSRCKHRAECLVDVDTLSESVMHGLRSAAHPARVPV